MSDALTKIVSPLEITLEWTRSLPEPAAILSIAAFELKKRSDKVEQFGSITFLGSSIDINGKATSDDAAIHLDVLDTTDNMAPFGRSRMTIDLDKVNVEKIKLCAYSIPEKKGKKLSFCDCVSAKVTIKDAAGQSFSQDLIQLAPKAGMMAISLGTLKGGRSWSYKAEPLPLSGGIGKLLDTYADKRVYSSYPNTQETIHNDLRRRISVYFEESLERARKEEEANRARRAAEEARRMAEVRRKFEEEKARLTAEEEARRKAEEERLHKEEEAKIKAEEERLKAEEEARRKAEKERSRKEEEERRKAEEERIRKEEEVKRKADEVARLQAEEAKRKAENKAASPAATPTQSRSKRWKRQVDKMHESSEPVSAVPEGDNALTDEQRNRKTKAWKSARIIRSSDKTLTPESLATEERVTASPTDPTLAPLGTRSLGTEKSWKRQVAKMHENEETVEPADEPVSITQDSSNLQEGSNKKRKFPKIRR